MFQSLDDIIKQYGLNFQNFSLSETIILQIFNSDELDIKQYDLENDDILTLIGNYYRYIKKDYDLMKKYYLISIEKENLSAMNCLGYYYNTVEKNYDLMKKYYLPFFPF
jgi:TPR repeat protein